MKPPRPFSVAAVLVALAAAVFAEAVKDREGAVRQDRARMENDARWIYNDVNRGFAEARRTGKPLLVTLRCVPCVSCMGIDAGVLTRPELAPLLDEFVCVRVINANALDLSLFQVDYDLSFSAVMFNGDGTVYGRFGSWTHQKNSQDTDIASFRSALEGAMAIHRAYPGNRSSLAGKQGVTMPFKTAVEIPLLAGRYQRELDWNGKVVGSCVHCHMIGDALRGWYRDQKKPVPTEWIYAHPVPETIGLTLAPDCPARVRSVAAGSVAALAGFRAGDDVLALAGQPLVSIADFSWVLHVAPDTATLPAVVSRDGAQQALSLVLPSGWRRRADLTRHVGAWGMRGMATGGLLLEDLPDEDRRRRGLGPGELALVVKFVGQYNKHAAAKKAGFQKDDVLVEIDGLKQRMTEGELFGRLLQMRQPGEKVDVVVLRGEQRLTLALPMQ